MRKKLGNFRHPIEFGDALGARFEQIEAWVGTGSWTLENFGLAVDAVSETLLQSSPCGSN